MIRAALPAGVLLPLLIAGNLHAEIFTWKDSRGDTHFVSSMYDVPERYRSRVRKLNLGIEEKSDTKQQQAAAPVPALSTDAPAATTQPLAAPPQPQPQITPSTPHKSGNRPSSRPRRSRPSEE